MLGLIMLSCSWPAVKRSRQQMTRFSSVKCSSLPSSTRKLSEHQVGKPIKMTINKYKKKATLLWSLFQHREQNSLLITDTLSNKIYYRRMMSQVPSSELWSSIYLKFHYNMFQAEVYEFKFTQSWCKHFKPRWIWWCLEASHKIH